MLTLIIVIINAAEASQEYKNAYLYKSWNRRWSTNTQRQIQNEFCSDYLRYDEDLSALLHAIPQHTAANSLGRKSGNRARNHASLTSCSTKELLFPSKNHRETYNFSGPNLSRNKYGHNNIFSSLCARDKMDKDFLFTSIKTDTLSNSCQNISNHPAFLPERQPPERPSLTETGQ